MPGFLTQEERIIIVRAMTMFREQKPDENSTNHGLEYKVLSELLDRDSPSNQGKNMSSTVRSYGFIAVLRVPILEDQRDDLNEKLYDEKSDIRVGYSGELLHIDFNRNKPYHIKEDIYGLFIGSDKYDPKGFLEEAGHHNLFVDLLTLRPYNCIWYNGTDNPVDMLTKEEFLKKVKP
jgi:hypothetical protein